MQAPQVTNRTTPRQWIWGRERYDQGYGMGWDTGVYRGHYLVSHTGSGGGFTTYIGFLPMDGIGVVVLTNHRLGYNVYPLPVYKAFDRLLGLEEIDWNARFKEYNEKREAGSGSEKKEGPRVLPPSLPLEEYMGTYEHPAYGRYVITLEGRTLRTKFNHFDAGPLKHVSLNEFTTQVRLIPPLSFNIDDRGMVVSLSAEWVEGSGIDPLIFKRIE